MRQRDLEKTLTDQMNDAQANINRGLDAVNKEQTKLDSYRAVFNALQVLLDRVRGLKKSKPSKKKGPTAATTAAADLASQKPGSPNGSPERPL